ncbi:MAG: hypothetical protein AB1591_05070 [Pseudomonadota bacterium]
MKRSALLLCLMASTAGAAPPPADCGAVEAEAFSVLPMLLPAGRGDRQGAHYCLSNLRAEAAAAWNGTGGFGSPKRLPVRKSGFGVSAGKTGNYHWLQATEKSALGVTTASTAHYFAAPGPAPTAMLQLPKAELEIVPQPLPREHWRYRAGETWSFLVRFWGEPLANTDVRLKTSGGARREYRTDERGIARVHFPLDATSGAHAVGHDHGRPEQHRFVLSVDVKGADGRRYLTTFNHHYGPPAGAGRSLPLGLGFLALGGLIALPLAMRRMEKKHG